MAFMSWDFKPTEQNYSAYEGELAAVAYCFIQCRHYLKGWLGGVTVIMDRKYVDSCNGPTCITPVVDMLDSTQNFLVDPTEN